MSDFVDNEAEESDLSSGQDEELSEGELPVKKKTKEKKKKKKQLQISDDEEEEEDDDDAAIAEEMADFINEDVEEEEDQEEDAGDSDGEEKKRKERSDEDDDQLDEEDFDLIDDNLGIKISRKQKRKRIKMMSDDEDSGKEEGGDGDDGKHAIEEELFDEDAEDGDRPEGSVRPVEESADVQEFDSEEESDVDDFIVDEEGNSISKGKKKKKNKIHTDSALQEAQEIFGVNFDFADFEKYDDEEDDFEDEDEYEDEDEGEEGTTRKKTGRKKSSKKSIFEVFEPSELERGHFTDRDNQIRATDMPERFQLRRVPVKEAEDAELEEESEWVYKQAFSTPCISQQTYLDMDHMGASNKFRGPTPNAMASKIKQALGFMRKRTQTPWLEVPFIAFYRKEYVEPELNINDLWRVYHWDEKWIQLCSRRSNMTRLFEKMKDYLYEQYSDPENPQTKLFRPITQTEIDRVKSVQTPEELRDVYQNFLLYYGHEIPNMRNSEGNRPREEGETDDQPGSKPHAMKQAHRISGYSLCLNAKLDEIARQFGLKPDEFGENIRDNYQRHDVNQCPLEPLELAKDYVCPQFPTTEDVLRGCQYMVAMQLAHDPLVRQSVRAAFQERAKIRVNPTKKGVKIIDESHNCYTLKYITAKPLKDLKDDTYLKLHNAEEEGLLTISIKMDEDEDTSSGSQSYFEEIKQLFYRDEFSHLVQQWNNQRSEALKRALYKILYPQMEKEVRTKLLLEAQEGVLKACARKLYSWLKVAPYQMDQQVEDEFDESSNEDGLKVLGIAFSTNMSQPSFGALIDGDAQVMEYIRLEHITKRKNAWREMDKKSKEKDLEKLKDFIAEKKPHVIAVTSESRQALMIMDDIKAVISELEQEQQMPPINVELVDNELAMIFENTNRASTEFRDYPPPLRHAISLARRLQDPLCEFAQLCNPDEDILCLKYHPLQDTVPKDDLLECLYLEFVNRVNEVGVDINHLLTFSYTAPLLQFVCGLGPRKANHIIKCLKQNNNRLENRPQLISLCDVGPSVFINCAGFIMIDTNQLGDTGSDVYVDVLDGSRVHPEAYEWARKMAVDALEYDDTAEDANPASAVEEILESPERLKDLDLDAFADELERQGYLDKHITLYDIRAELNHRYKDLRTPYRSPSSEEKFNMLTRETPETFYVGKLVQATVTGIAHKRPQGDQLDQANPVRDEESGLWQCPFCHSKEFPELSDVWSHFDGSNCPGAAVGVKCRLESGVSGFLHTKNLSDKMVRDPQERVKVGQLIHCRITKIDIERFQVELTSKSSDLLDKDSMWRPQKDIYYDYDTEKQDADKENDKKKMQARQTYMKRVIAHPYFNNVSFKECEKLLMNMDQGDVIIRPSSKGTDHLTATWKVADGIVQHIDIREEGKENAFSLGRSLWIDGEVFEDLDEIIARHIQPMAATVRDIMAFKYYKDSEGGKRDILDKFLSEEKKKSNSKIPYCLTASKQYPGKFMLSYKPRNICRHEYVTMTAEGMRYRGQIFTSVNSLIRWFKEHFRDPIPGTPASRTPAMSAYTPGAHQTPGRTPSGRTPSGRTPAGMSSNMYSAHHQTPRGTTPRVGTTPRAYGNYGASMPYQPGMTPVMTPMFTPSSSYGGAQGMVSATPNMGLPITTPRGTIMGGVTPSNSGTYQTPSVAPSTGMHWPGATPRTPVARTHATPRQTPSAAAAATSGGDMDWARAAEIWANRNKTSRSPRASPALSATRSPAPSPARVAASPQGDGTPLIDER